MSAVRDCARVLVLVLVLAERAFRVRLRSRLRRDKFWRSPLECEGL
jgi:hypothetical protein